MEERFIREEMLLGHKAMERLAAAHVAVYGLGGVGGNAAEALVRGGIGRLTLIDGDTVAPSNINRQAFALQSTVGLPKTEAAARRLLDINPSLGLELKQGMYLPESREEFFVACDYIVDAIDMVTAKLDLIETALSRGVPVISSLGTGNKLDPSRLRVADISETRICPLARVMRRELRKRGIEHLCVVFSEEEPLVPRFQPNEEPGTAIRRATPGSVSWVPPAAGLLLAGHVIVSLVGS